MGFSGLGRSALLSGVASARSSSLGLEPVALTSVPGVTALVGARVAGGVDRSAGVGWVALPASFAGCATTAAPDAATPMINTAAAANLILFQSIVVSTPSKSVAVVA